MLLCSRSSTAHLCGLNTLHKHLIKCIATLVVNVNTDLLLVTKCYDTARQSRLHSIITVNMAGLLHMILTALHLPCKYNEH